MMHVGIIGGGAAGMTAAIAAARNGARVTVFERGLKPGKKLLSTGNGRCNLTNENMSGDHLYSGDASFAKAVLGAFGMLETLRFFEHIGIHAVKNNDGYYYPRSMQASSVRNALEAEMAHLGVQLLTDAPVRSVSREAKGFCVHTEHDEIHVDKLILSCGGNAAPSTGSDGSGYALAKKLGLNVITPVPALVPLKSSWRELKDLNGIRVKAKVELSINQEPAAAATGELQLCDYGLSGIPVFQISRHASRAFADLKDPRVDAAIDFFTEFTETELEEYLCAQANVRAHVRCGDFLSGLLPDKLGRKLLKQTGIDFDRAAKSLSNKEIHSLTHICKHLCLPVTGTLGFERAQISAGGVDTRSIDPKTMECRDLPGIYLAGEIINVDGICGGYNLQFAWSSGHLAGTAAAKASH